MHPRHLWGPTFVVVGIMLLGAIGLLALHPAAVDPDDLTFEELIESEDFEEFDGATFKRSYLKSVKQEMLGRAIGGIVACAVVCFIPMRSATTAWLLRPVIFMIVAMVSEIIKDTCNGKSDVVLTKLAVLMGLSVIGITLYKAMAKSLDCDSKIPACSAWLDRTRHRPIEDNDPDAIDRLKHFQNVANGMPRGAS